MNSFMNYDEQNIIQISSMLHYVRHLNEVSSEIEKMMNTLAESIELFKKRSDISQENKKFITYFISNMLIEEVSKISVQKQTEELSFKFDKITQELKDLIVKIQWLMDELNKMDRS